MDTIYNLNYDKELVCECGNDEFYSFYVEKSYVRVDGKGNVLEENGLEESYLESNRECTKCKKKYDNI